MTISFYIIYFVPIAFALQFSMNTMLLLEYSLIAITHIFQLCVCSIV